MIKTDESVKGISGAINQNTDIQLPTCQHRNNSSIPEYCVFTLSNDHTLLSVNMLQRIQVQM